MKREEFLNRFNFESYIESKFSDVTETSTPDRIRVICPFCDDKSSHLYVLISAGLVYCQRCKYNPKSPVKFISDLEGIPIKSVLRIAEDNVGFYREQDSVSDVVAKLFNDESNEKEFSYEKISLDDSFVPVFESVGIPAIDRRIRDAREYLINREITEEDILAFDIRFCYEGKYSGRVIVPCMYNGDFVSFVGRDIFGVSDRKYLNPIGNKQSDFLFNLDSVDSNTVVLTEGVFDAIKTNSIYPSVASFGKSLSRRQIDLLNRFKKVIFYWDRDAYPQAERYAREIQAECVTVLHPDGMDAGARDAAESKRLIGESVHFDSAAYQLFRSENRVDTLTLL